MPIVTISRGAFSGGERLAEKLRERLGFKVVSREVIVEAAEKYGVDERRLAADLHSPAGLWRRMTHQQERFILAVQATLAEMVADDDVIYHGLAGQFLLRGLHHVIKIRLNAPMEHRIRMAMSERGIGRAEATRLIETDDDERARWVRHLYQAEWTDPGLYELVLNLEHIGLDTAAELIARLVRSDEYRSTPAARQRLKDFALETRIQANLTFHSKFSLSGLEVSARDGIVEISGGQDLDKDRRAVVEYVKTLEGVRRVVPDDEAKPEDQAAAAKRDDRKASEVMVAIKGYPHIHESTTIKQALLAIGASVVVLEDGHQISPRYVLVFDDEERLVGVVSRRDLLRGLSPQAKSFETSMTQLGAMAPLAKMSPAMTTSWQALLGPAAIANGARPVKDIMAPIRGTVERNDDLGTVVSAMLRHRIDLVPVMDGGKTVGVVLMTDVFDIVAEYVLEGGRGTPRAPSGAG